MACLDANRDVARARLCDSLWYVLKPIVQVAGRAGVRLAIHPYNPPWPIFGQPRIITNARALERLVAPVDSPANGVTFCTGSLCASPPNHPPASAPPVGWGLYFSTPRT